MYFSSKRQKIQLTFEDDDIDIVEPAKQQGQGFMVGFVVLYTDGMNTEVMPKSFMHDFISSRDDNLAGYKVIMVDGQNEGSPAGHHSAAPQHKSKSKYIYIGVGLALALVVVLVLVFVVKRFVSCIIHYIAKQGEQDIVHEFLYLRPERVSVAWDEERKLPYPS